MKPDIPYFRGEGWGRGGEGEGIYQTGGEICLECGEFTWKGGGIKELIPVVKGSLFYFYALIMLII